MEVEVEGSSVPEASAMSESASIWVSREAGSRALKRIRPNCDRDVMPGIFLNITNYT